MQNSTQQQTQNSPKLADRVRDKIRYLHYAYSTEKTYLMWVDRFLRFHREQSGTWIHPLELGPGHLEGFLTDLAVQRVDAKP